MPNRILRDGILDSKLVARLSEPGEVFYRRLMSVVDDYGRYEADLELLRVKCFPRILDKWPEVKVQAALEETIAAALVLVYVVKPKIYLQMSNFQQRLRSPSKFPPSDDGQVADTWQAAAGLACASHTHTTTHTNGLVALSESEWPETTAAIQFPFPATDSPFIMGIIHQAIQAGISAGAEASEVTDRLLAEAVKTAIATGRVKGSAGLLRNMVPQIIASWAKQ